MFYAYSFPHTPAVFGVIENKHGKRQELRDEYGTMHTVTYSDGTPPANVELEPVPVRPMSELTMYGEEVECSVDAQGFLFTEELPDHENWHFCGGWVVGRVVLAHDCYGIRKTLHAYISRDGETGNLVVAVPG